MRIGRWATTDEDLMSIFKSGIKLVKSPIAPLEFSADAFATFLEVMEKDGDYLLRLFHPCSTLYPSFTYDDET